MLITLNLVVLLLLDILNESKIIEVSWKCFRWKQKIVLNIQLETNRGRLRKHHNSGYYYLREK